MRVHKLGTLILLSLTAISCGGEEPPAEILIDAVRAQNCGHVEIDGVAGPVSCDYIPEGNDLEDFSNNGEGDSDGGFSGFGGEPSAIKPPKILGKSSDEPLEYCLAACEVGGNVCYRMCQLFFEDDGNGYQKCHTGCTTGGQLCDNMCHWYFGE